MRIATWNVNGIRARLEFVLHWLDARRPDLVGLQELKVTDEQFPYAEIEAAGYQSAVLGQKGWNGVAVLSRDGVEVTQSGLAGQEELGSRLLTARLGELSFTTIYAPNGKSVDHDDYERKLAWFDALAGHLDGRIGGAEQAVVCGDFNVVPAPLDSWDEQRLHGSVFHTDEERARIHRLYDMGLEDLFRKLEPESRTFSWWDYRGGAFHRNQGLRIDYLLATGNVAARVCSVETDRDYRKKKDGMTASDHAPVIAELTAPS